ncbi:MAG: hypothetical protein ACREL5_01390 [Gemmatimonadales bacterium]
MAYHQPAPVKALLIDIFRIPIRRGALAAVALLASCSHSDAFSPTTSRLGPFTTGDEVQLTYNLDQDYWPTWTEDGQGILYAFVNPGASVGHRCVGLLPAAGGTRLWELCDNRYVRRDSLSSYSAYALDSTGRLLLAEAVSPRGFDFPLHAVLFLTDTANPYLRSSLLTLPITAGNVTITWLSDLAWTSPNGFIALGQQFNSGPHCYRCACGPCPTDSIFGNNGVVVVGAIAGGAATVRAVDGTQGAQGYALSDDRTTVFFFRFGDRRLLKVALAGGAATPVATISDDAGQSLIGVTCRATTCVVATAPVLLTKPDVFGFTLLTDSTSYLVTVSLTDGSTHPIDSFAGILATPQMSRSGDLVVAFGAIVGSLDAGPAPVLGHLATFAGGNSDLRLYKGFVR